MLWPRIGRADVVQRMAASWLALPRRVSHGPGGDARGKRVVINYRGGEAREFFLGTAGWHRLRSRWPDDTAPSSFWRARSGSASGWRYRSCPRFSTARCSTAREREIRQRCRDEAPREDVRHRIGAQGHIGSVQARHSDATLWIAVVAARKRMRRNLVAAWGLANVRFLGELFMRACLDLRPLSDIYLKATLVDNFPARSWKQRRRGS